MSTAERKKKTTLFLGISWLELLGIAIMFGWRLIPIPEPMTEAGWQCLGALLGVAFIFTTVGPSWGCFVGWLAMAPAAKVLQGGAHGMWAVTTITLGDWLTVFILVSLLLCYPLKESGFMKRFGYWFMNRSFAKKSPWAFLFSWIIMCFLLSILVETDTTAIFFMGVAYTIFERVGFKKGDKFPALMMIGTVFAVMLGYCCTPIAHGSGYKGLAVYVGLVEGVSDMPLVQYFLITFPVCLLTVIALLLVMRYVVKPDVSKLEGVNYGALLGDKPEPMSKREKLTVGIYLTVVVFWMLPSFLSFFPATAFSKWLDEYTSLGIGLTGLAAMALIKVDGKPLFNFREAFKSIPWSVIMVMSTTRGLATLLAKPDAGFNAWITKILTETIPGMSPFVILAFVCLILAITTNFASNTPITVLGVTILVPQAAVIGIPAPVLATLATVSAGLALTFPSGFVLIGYLQGDEWNLKGTQMKLGGLGVLLCWILTITLGFGLGMLFF